MKTVDETTEIPTVPPTPTKIPRQPMEPETRAWFIGTVAGMTLFAGMVVGVCALITGSDRADARSKAQQVEACAEIQEPNAAFLCVEQVDD